jgi:4-hydroxy-4-methyl-2-oxoglutarate aldolase
MTMNAERQGTDPVVQLMRESFFSALISDVLDDLGHRNQALPTSIRPLDESLKMVGRARTMLYADIYALPGPDENPHAGEIKLVDSLRTDDIVVCACGTSGRIAPWGSLMSTAASVRGAAGALMDGMVRDIAEIRALKLPVYHGGIGPLDSKGRARVIDTDVPVACGGVAIAPGDLIIGDADGVVVVPRAIEAAVVAAAKEKLKGENKTKAALLAGRSLADVYEEFGVL